MGVSGSNGDGACSTPTVNDSRFRVHLAGGRTDPGSRHGGRGAPGLRA